MEEPRIRRLLVVHPGKDPIDMHVAVEPGYGVRLIGRSPRERWESPYGAFGILGHAQENGPETPLNCTLSDYCGNAWCTLYGSFWISGMKDGGYSRELTDKDIEIYSRIFSLDERTKPLEEQAKLIQELCPPGKTHMYTPPYLPTGTPPSPYFDESDKYIPPQPSYMHDDNAPAVPVKNKDYTPHCPICGSPDIEKITLAQKAFGGFMFGLFSKTAKSQFKCNNCGAKF